MNKPWLQRAIPVPLVLAFLSACGPAPHVESPETLDSDSEIESSRVTLQQLRESRFAPEATVELRRAERWLGDAEVQLREGDDEPTQLTLLAVRTQLSAIKSFYQRREAEGALETAASAYREGEQRVRDLERSEADFSTEGGER